MCMNVSNQSVKDTHRHIHKVDASRLCVVTLYMKLKWNFCCATLSLLCKFAGFCSRAVEVSILLGCGMASVDGWCLMFEKRVVI